MPKSQTHSDKSQCCLIVGFIYGSEHVKNARFDLLVITTGNVPQSGESSVPRWQLGHISVWRVGDTSVVQASFG